MDEFRQQKFFPSLDGIRCLCILAVIQFHAYHWDSALPMANRGFLGVDMFFVVSGFLIVTLLLREKERTGTVALGAFYWRRLLRIHPPYLLMVVGLAVYYQFFAPNSKIAADTLAGLPAALTFTANWVATLGMFNILWSLATEEQFYLVWPWVQKYLPPRAIVVFLLAVLAVSQAVNFRLVTTPLDSLSIMEATFTPIALGALLANLLHHRRSFAAVAAATGFRGAPVVWGLGLLGALNLPGADIQGAERLVIQVTMAGFLASCVVRPRHALSAFLEWGPVARVGKVSYGMYLYHLVVLAAVGIVLAKVGLPSTGLQAALTLVATWAAAEVSFRFWESPFLKLKDRVPFRRSQESAAGK